MKISLCFGTLNRKAILTQMIEGVLKEAGKYSLDMEIVPVDGGSEDGTVDYLKGINDMRVKPLLLGIRSSYPDFMNRAIKHSTGGVIVQWNDDTFMCPGGWAALNKQSEQQLQDKKIAGFRFLHRSLGDSHTNSFFDCDDGAWEHNRDHMRDFHFMCFGAYYRRTFEQFGMYHPDIMFYHCDTEFCYRVILLTGGYHTSIPFLSACKVHHLKITYNNQDTLGSSGEQDRKMCNRTIAWIKQNRKVPVGVEYLQ